MIVHASDEGEVNHDEPFAQGRSDGFFRRDRAFTQPQRRCRPPARTSNAFASHSLSHLSFFAKARDMDSESTQRKSCAPTLDDTEGARGTAVQHVANPRCMRTLSSFVALLTLPAMLALASGCASAPAPGDEENAVSSGEQALTSNEKAAYDFFVAKGLSKVQSAGIVGNLIQESNVLPGSVQPGGPGRGIAQWSVGGR